MIPVAVAPCPVCERTDYERRPGDGGTIICCPRDGHIAAITRDPGGSLEVLTSDPESPSLHRVTLTLCSLCLLGEGGQCHTPGCALWLKAAPDIPLWIETGDDR